MRGQSARRREETSLFVVARHNGIHHATIRALAILFVGLVAACCGGGGNGGRSIAGVGITISPSVVSVEAGDSQQFTATVTGTTNTAVTWSVNDVEGGGATVGTISPAGLYTAPAAVPSPDTVTVKATSVADSAKSAAAQVTITPPILRLTSLAPLTVIRSFADFDLDVYGRRFSAASQVVFNGTLEPTSYLGDSTRLRARISSTEIAAAGSYSVVVRDDDETSNALQFYVVPPVLARDVRVAAGGTNNDINIAVTPVSAPALALLAVGEGNTAGGTGITLLQGGATDLFLAGKGIVPGTFYMIAGDSRDIAVTQPLAADFQTAHDQDGNPIPAVTIQISALPDAAPGPRNILVTNPDGEISVFVGGVLVAAGP
jgi:hypothetical protein